jgi:hypothetical protein
MFGKVTVNDSDNTMGAAPAGRPVLPTREQRAVLDASPELSDRDMRDLLMEYGADGGTASALVARRRGNAANGGW